MKITHRNQIVLPYRWIFSAILVFIIADLIFTSIQFFHQPIAGDLVQVVLPAERFQQILENPFGQDILLNQDTYAGSNRFFVHWSLYHYFRMVPALLRQWTNPLDALYFSTAFFKLFLHLGLLLTLSSYIKGEWAPHKHDFWMILALCIPFFQSFGFHRVIGLIDISIVYAFSYALPILGFLIWFFPFYLCFRREQTIQDVLPPMAQIGWLVFAYVLSMSGPLITPLYILCIGSLFLLQVPAILKYLNQSKLSSQAWGIYAFALACSLFSWYLGQFNAENDASLSLLERYALLPKGVWRICTMKNAAIWYLIGHIGFNLWTIKTSMTSLSSKWKRVIIWITFILAAYLLLLPVGGYRPYRPLIVRYDTFIPVSLALIFGAVGTIYWILKRIDQWAVRSYRWAVPLLIGLIFQLADYNGIRRPSCEYRALKDYIQRPDTSLFQNHSCAILDWEQASSGRSQEEIAQILCIWKISPPDKCLLEDIK